MYPLRHLVQALILGLLQQVYLQQVEQRLLQAQLLLTTYTVTGTTALCTATQTVVVTVSATLVGGSVGSDQTICASSTPAAFTSTSAASGGSGGITYQWESSNDNSIWSNCDWWIWFD